MPHTSAMGSFLCILRTLHSLMDKAVGRLCLVEVGRLSLSLQGRDVVEDGPVVARSKLVFPKWVTLP